MDKFKCTICGQEWTSNYCPECSHTIERSAEAKTADPSSSLPQTAWCRGQEPYWEFVPKNLKANPKFIKVYSSKEALKRAFESHEVRTSYVYRKHLAGEATSDTEQGQWLPIPDATYSDLGLSKDALISAEKKIDRQAIIILLGLVVALIGFLVWCFTSPPELPSMAVPEGAPVVSFRSYHLDSQKDIKQESLFVALTYESTIVDSLNSSPFNDRIPKNVFSYNKYAIGAPSLKRSAVVIQEIPTEWHSSYYFDGSMRADNLFAGIFRHIPRMKIVQIPIQLIHLPFVIVGELVRPPRNNPRFRLHIDNALGRDIRICLDGKVGPRLPAKHNICIVFREGRRNLSIVEGTGDRRLIETFTTDFVRKDSDAKEYYVYNIGGTNSYRVEWVVYEFPKP